MHPMMKLAVEYSNSGKPEVEQDPITIQHEGRVYFQVGHNASHEFFFRQDENGNIHKLACEWVDAGMQASEYLVEDFRYSYWGHF